MMESTRENTQKDRTFRARPAEFLWDRLHFQNELRISIANSHSLDSSCSNKYAADSTDDQFERDGAVVFARDSHVQACKLASFFR